LLIFTLSSCAGVRKVPDVPICAEVTMARGKCSYTVTAKKIDVDDEKLLNGKTWFDIRVQSLTVPAESWAELRSWIISICKRYKCDADIASWDRMIETIDSAIDKK
jgi:hypothetical protein